MKTIYRLYVCGCLWTTYEDLEALKSDYRKNKARFKKLYNNNVYAEKYTLEETLTLEDLGLKRK